MRKKPVVKELPLAPLPRSRAKTAYGLMAAVNRVLLAEPARLYMGTWVAAFRNKQAARGEVTRFGVTPPVCGTIGCYAGWTTILHTGRHPGDAESEALRLLAGNNFYLRKRLDGEFLSTSVGHRPGTKAYAKLVVERFQRVMAEFKDDLQARKL